MIEAEDGASFDLRCGLRMNAGADTALGIGNRPAHPEVNPVFKAKEDRQASVGSLRMPRR
jgi:hypothetical protein